MVAVIRPENWEWPLFLHVAGALLLVGGLVVVVTAGAAAVGRDRIDEAAALRRFTFWMLVAVCLPAWILMRLAGEWVLDREGDPEASWIDIGFTIADTGLILLVVVAILSWFAARRTRGENRRPATALVALPLAAAYLAALFLAIWAMTAKPE